MQNTKNFQPYEYEKTTSKLIQKELDYQPQIKNYITTHEQEKILYTTILTTIIIIILIIAS